MKLIIISIIIFCFNICSNKSALIIQRNSTTNDKDVDAVPIGDGDNKLDKIKSDLHKLDTTVEDFAFDLLKEIFNEFPNENYPEPDTATIAGTTEQSKTKDEQFETINNDTETDYSRKTRSISYSDCQQNQSSSQQDLDELKSELGRLQQLVAVFRNGKPAMRDDHKSYGNPTDDLITITAELKEMIDNLADINENIDKGHLLENELRKQKSEINWLKIIVDNLMRMDKSNEENATTKPHQQHQLNDFVQLMHGFEPQHFPQQSPITDQSTISNLDQQLISDLKGMVDVLDQQNSNDAATEQTDHHEVNSWRRKRSTGDNSMDANKLGEILTSRLMGLNNLEKSADAAENEATIRSATLPAPSAGYAQGYAPAGSPPHYSIYDNQVKDVKKTKTNDIFSELVGQIIDKLIASIPTVLQKLFNVAVDDLSSYGYSSGSSYGGTYELQSVLKNLGVFGYLPLILLRLLNGLTDFIKILKRNTFLRTFLVPAGILITVGGSIIFLVWWLQPDYDQYAACTKGYDSMYQNNGYSATSGYAPGNDGGSGYAVPAPAYPSAEQSYQSPASATYSRSYYENNNGGNERSMDNNNMSPPQLI